MNRNEKEDAAIDWWAKELAPSTELRKWFGHEPKRWKEFQHRYFKELDAQAEAFARLAGVIEREPVTICFGSKETRYNNAVALQIYLGRGETRR